MIVVSHILVIQDFMSFTDAKSYSVQQNDRVVLSHQKVNDLDGLNSLPIDVILM